MEIEKTEKGIRRCADFLKCCLDLGWDKSDLYDLESLFWKFKDKNGDLKPKSSSTAAAILSGEDWKEDGWVSVDEKLPKKNEEYIVCGKGFEGRIVTTMEWKNKKWFSDVYQKYIEQIKITHWMALPEPPKP